MKTDHIIATKAFDEVSQRHFADFSGDQNPLHMDALAARRSPAGGPVVHGMHALLWGVDELARQNLLPGRAFHLRATFHKWIPVDAHVSLTLSGPSAATVLSFFLEVNGSPVTSGEISPAEQLEFEKIRAEDVERMVAPLNLPVTEMAAQTDRAFCGSEAHATEHFPALSRVISPAAVSEMAACSYVVGMLVPGLYSMFSKVDLFVSNTEASTPALHYAASRLDERFRKVILQVNGTSVRGSLQAFLRQPPIEQPSPSQLRGRVIPGEFATIQALITGGSRGLGALTANLIAAGGGTVTITYASGRDDAHRIVDAIRAEGRTAFAVQYRSEEPADKLLDALPHLPTHLFHFASGPIQPSADRSLNNQKFKSFIQTYVAAFETLCSGIIFRQRKDGLAPALSAFYPSTVFLDELPAGFAEYLKAKAAGEELCAEMSRRIQGLRITIARLPKLSTDQTAGILPEKLPDAVSVLLPLIRSMISR